MMRCETEDILSVYSTKTKKKKKKSKSKQRDRRFINYLFIIIIAEWKQSHKSDSTTDHRMKSPEKWKTHSTRTGS